MTSGFGLLAAWANGPTAVNVILCILCAIGIGIRLETHGVAGIPRARIDGGDGPAGTMLLVVEGT